MKQFVFAPSGYFGIDGHDTSSKMNEESQGGNGFTPNGSSSYLGAVADSAADKKIS